MRCFQVHAAVINDYQIYQMIFQHFVFVFNLGCMSPLGMENRAILDAQIKASSQLDETHTAKQSRLHSQADEDKRGSWSALRSDVNQWLQVDLGSYTRVTGVATQGRNGHYEWVTKFRLQYSDDGDIFHSFEDPGNVAAKVCMAMRLFRHFNYKEKYQGFSARISWNNLRDSVRVSLGIASGIQCAYLLDIFKWYTDISRQCKCSFYSIPIVVSTPYHLRR